VSDDVLTAAQRLELAVLESDYELSLEREEFVDLLRVTAQTIRFLTGLTREQIRDAAGIAPMAIQAAAATLSAHEGGLLTGGSPES